MILGSPPVAPHLLMHSATYALASPTPFALHLTLRPSYAPGIVRDGVVQEASESVSPEPFVILFGAIIGFGLPILGVILLVRGLKALKGHFRYSLDALIVFVFVSGAILGSIVPFVPNFLPGLILWVTIEIWMVDGILFLARGSDIGEIGWVQAVKGVLLGLLVYVTGVMVLLAVAFALARFLT